jgi:hypothetical protein
MDDTTKKDASSRRTWLAAVALLLLLLLLLLGWVLWPDGRVEAAKAAQAALRDPKLPPDQRKAKRDQLRQAMDKLTPAQREALRAEARKRRAAELANYFRMSPKEKADYLDGQIDRMNAARRNRQAGGNGGQAGGSGGPGAGGRGNGGTPPTTAQREQWRQDRLDSTTPAERGMWSQYFQDLAARRKQLGLPPQGRPRG